MNRSKPFTWIASAIFAIMAIVHLYRLVRPFDVAIGSWSLPIWVSAVAAVITAVLSWMLCREARGTSGP